MFFLKRREVGVSKMAQQIKVLANKSEDPSSVPGPHMMEGQK